MKKIYTLLISVLFFSSSSNAQTPGNSLQFDGSNDYVSTALPTLFNNISGNDFTIETWVKPDVMAGSQRIFFAQLSGSQFVSVLINASNEVYVYVYGSGANSFKTNSSIPLSQWTHIAFSWEALNQQVLIYFNGILQSTAGGGSSTSGNNNVMTIGSRSDGIQNFNGEIDEFRIWNYKRSECEIQAGMTSEYTIPQNNLIAYYKFNVGMAGGLNTNITSIPDFTGNYNGTLNNFALTGNTSNFLSSGAIVTQINQSGNFNISTSEDICAGESYIFGTQTLASPGLYTDTFTTVFGCDSIVNLTLNVNNADTSVTQLSGDSLQANATNATFQWLDCDDNFSVLLNETNQVFTSTINGNYAVEITQNGCIDTSDCYNLVSIGISEYNFSHLFHFYPNPTDNQIKIKIDETIKYVVVKLYNVKGQIVMNEELINRNQLEIKIDDASGIYTLMFETPDGRYASFKILKK